MKPCEEISPREREVLSLICKGMTNAQIGKTLGMARSTAAKHISHILILTGMGNRTELAIWALSRQEMPTT